MMYVSDAPGPGKGDPAIDKEYVSPPAFAPDEDVAPESEVPAEPGDEYVPPEEGPGSLKVPDEFRQATDDESLIDLEPIPSAKEEIETGNEIDKLLKMIDEGTGDLDKAAAHLVWEIDKEDVSTARKKATLGGLVGIHNTEGSSEKQREAVKHAFRLIRAEGSEEIFRLGMLASAKLADEQEELAAFVKVFAQRGHEDGDVKVGSEDCNAFLKSVRTIAEMNPELTKRIIDKFLELWFETPSSTFLWNALMVIADVDASYETTTDDEKKVTVTLGDAVRKKFIAKYKGLSEDEQKDAARTIMLAMRDEVPDAHVDIIRSMIKKGTDPVRAKILFAIEELDAQYRKGEIELDNGAMMECYSALIAQAKKGCFLDEADCPKLVDALHEDRRKYAPKIDFSFGATVRNLGGLYGEPMDTNTAGMGFSFEWLSGEFSGGARLLLGAHFAGWKNSYVAGARVGTAFTGGPITVKLVAALEYMYLKDVEDGFDDVPIQLMDPPVTPGGTAYRMEPHEMNFIMNAGALVLRPEIDIAIHRWKLGGGKTLALKGFISLQAGLFAGGVYDDGCSYTYDPTSDDEVNVTPLPGKEGYITQNADLGTRCRSNKPVFGTIFGAEAGLALEFGL